jgi:hypothetical protein
VNACEKKFKVEVEARREVKGKAYQTEQQSNCYRKHGSGGIQDH